MELFTFKQRVKPTGMEVEAIQIVDAMMFDIRQNAADEELCEAAEKIAESLNDFCLKFLLRD